MAIKVEIIENGVSKAYLATKNKPVAIFMDDGLESEGNFEQRVMVIEPKYYKIRHSFNRIAYAAVIRFDEIPYYDQFDSGVWDHSDEIKMLLGKKPEFKLIGMPLIRLSVIRREHKRKIN